MSIKIKAGTKGWFMTRFQNSDVAEFSEDTPIMLQEHSAYWMVTVGEVPGFPNRHPPIMIYKHDLGMKVEV